MIRVSEDRDEMSGPADQAARSTQWQAYFESNEVEAVHGGVLVMRRRQAATGSAWKSCTRCPRVPSESLCGESSRITTILENHSDEELLAYSSRSPASARLQKQFAISPEGWRHTSVELQLGEGLPYSIVLQPQVADFIGACNGQRTLGEVADAMAAALSVDPATVRRETCGIVRQIAERGMMML